MGAECVCERERCACVRCACVCAGVTVWAVTPEPGHPAGPTCGCWWWRRQDGELQLSAPIGTPMHVVANVPLIPRGGSRTSIEPTTLIHPYASK